MRIMEIRIKNFRSHEESAVHFNNGINLIVGRNGTGKSSILEAIFASLYLGLPGFPKGYKEANTRIGREGFVLKLIFDHNGKTYEIYRDTLSGKAALKENGKIIAEKDSDIARWVERYIYPMHVYRNAVYIKQGEIEGILVNEDVREKVLRKVLEIEDYENAERNSGAVIRELKRKKSDLEGFVRGVGNVEEQIREEEKRLIDVIKEINSLSKELERLRERLSLLEKEYKELKELKERLESVEKELIGLRGKCREREKLVSNLEEQERDLKNEVAKLEKKVKRLKDLEKVASEYERLKNLLALKDSKQNYEKKLEVSKQKLEGIREKIKVIKEKAKLLEYKKAKYGQKMSELKELEPLKEEYEDLAQRAKELEKIKRELRKYGYTREEVIKELEKIEQAKKEIDMIETEINELSSLIGALSEREEELKENMKRLKGQKVCPLCKRPIKEHEAGEIEEEYALELRKVSKEKKKAQEKLESLKKRKAELQNLLKNERGLIKIQKLVELIEGLEKDLRDVNLEELEEKARRHETIKDELSKLAGEIKQLERDAEDLTRYEKERETYERLISQFKQKLSEIENKIKEEGFSSFDEIEEKISQLESRYREYYSLKDSPKQLDKRKAKLSYVISNIEKLRNDVENLKKRISEKEEEKLKIEVRFSRERFENVERDFRETSNRLSEIKATLRERERLKEELTKRTEDLKKKREELKTAKETMELLDKIIVDMTEFKKKLRTYKAEVERRGLLEVERLASEIFSEMTERKYQGIRIVRKKSYGREKIQINVVYNRQERDLSFLSGGELIALGLAFRLALSLYKVRHIELLVLDEPTPFLDEEKRRKLIEIIGEHLRKIPQVIIVSHDEELKDAADHVIRVSSHAGISRVEVESLVSL